MENFESQFLVTQQRFIQRVYQWMAAGLSLTGLTAFWASQQAGIIHALMGGGFLILMLAELGIVIWLTAAINKISAAAATAGFMIYSILNGLTLCYIFLVYTGASIATTFFIAAASFAGISLFGWVTKTDLTSIRGYLAMALIGFLIATVVNIFLRSEVFYWILSYIGIAIFIGLTASDTQKLKIMHQSGGGSEKLAISGALQLYLDFVNFFLLLLRLFGRRR